MTTVRSAGFALFCVLVMAAILVPAARAQRQSVPDSGPRGARTLAQEKINPRVMAAIYHRRGDAKGKSVVTPGSGGASIQVDRHGRALVDVPAAGDAPAPRPDANEATLDAKDLPALPPVRVLGVSARSVTDEILWEMLAQLFDLTKVVVESVGSAYLASEVTAVAQEKLPAIV